MKVKVEMAPEEMIVAVKCYEELKAYRKTGYTPEQITELHDKHWMECMQIAQYDNELNGNRGWIPCSERMPELGVAVHVYAVRDGVGYMFDAFITNGEKNKWFTYDTTKMQTLKSNAVCESYTVTHWMPLHEPPVEQQGKEDEEK